MGILYRVNTMGGDTTGGDMTDTVHPETLDCTLSPVTLSRPWNDSCSGQGVRAYLLGRVHRGGLTIAQNRVRGLGRCLPEPTLSSLAVFCVLFGILCSIPQLDVWGYV